MSFFSFAHCALPSQAEALRREVREFLAVTLAGRSAIARAQSWDGFDPDFSRKVGARGWIGMTWPKIYGGGERSALERYVVIEEMLAAGARADHAAAVRMWPWITGELSVPHTRIAI